MRVTVIPSYSSVPRKTLTVSNIPIGKIIREIMIDKQPTREYSVLGTCTVALKNGDNVDTFLFQLGHIAICYQIRRAISRNLIPVEEVLVAYNTRTGDEVMARIDYTIGEVERGGNVVKIRGKVSIVKEREKHIPPAYPMTRKCESKLAPFITITRASRMKRRMA